MQGTGGEWTHTSRCHRYAVRWGLLNEGNILDRGKALVKVSEY
jgi:hypothetical protein